MFAERRHKMSRYKFIAISALITLAFGVTLISDALAGEKVKGRNTYYTTKWQQIPVGDEEGHVIALWESKSITTIFQGKAIPDGLVGRTVGSIDMGKTGVRYLHYINEFTDKDGDKIYCGEGKGRGGRDEPGQMGLSKRHWKIRRNQGRRKLQELSIEPATELWRLGSRGGVAEQIDPSGNSLPKDSTAEAGSVIWPCLLSPSQPHNRIYGLVARLFFGGLPELHRRSRPPPFPYRR
jgi:hypothetical protein